MKKKLTRHGNSMALVIDKPILELLGADAKTTFELTTDGQALVLTPVQRKSRAAAFRSALERVNRNFAEDLKELAK